MDVPTCKGCRERDARLAKLEAEVAQLRHLVRELQARLGQNASNSSIPPSANPPQAPPPVQKQPTGRKPGGQPGHTAHLRVRLPPERLTEPTVYYRPKTCAACAHDLPLASDPDDPEPRWHQVVELPEMPVQVTEYQAQGRTCPHCGEITWAKIADAIRAHGCGPRLTATLSYLSAVMHASKRNIEDFVETVLTVPIALGTVSNLEQEMSAALAAAHAEAQQAVQQAPAKNVDETGWKQAGAKRWLWGAATALVVCFVITPSRSAVGLAALLGKKIKGIISSDRWSVYGQLRVGLRQLCWAHLKRDFQKLVDRGGASADYGTSCADAKTATFCQNLLAVEPASWTFLSKEGVEPTNNHIERLLRSEVLWRKNVFGCHSESGCRFVERILTITQTLRLQQRPVLEFLYHSLVAHRKGLPAPALLAEQ